MIYNVICGVSFILYILMSGLLEKTRKKELILRILSIVIFVYKATHYILENIKGNLCIPVEISCISYFLIPLILSFRIKKLYNVGAFFGIAAGIGYFAFYTACGFTVYESFSVTDILTGCFCHGYLFLCGLYLFKNYTFDEKGKLSIWVALLGMLAWALVFYDVEIRGITFIYYIIKPQFLLIFQSMPLNVIIIMVYYLVLTVAFYGVVKLFYKLNSNPKLLRKRLLTAT